MVEGRRVDPEQSAHPVVEDEVVGADVPVEPPDVGRGQDQVEVVRRRLGVLAG